MIPCVEDKEQREKDTKYPVGSNEPLEILEEEEPEVEENIIELNGQQFKLVPIQEEEGEEEEAFGGDEEGGDGYMCWDCFCWQESQIVLGAPLP